MSRNPDIVWIDATAGASGDMLLGALVDAGVPLRVIRQSAARLPVRGWTLSSRRVVRAGLAARQVRVGFRGSRRDDLHLHRGDRKAQGHGRTRKDLLAILRRADLPSPVRERATETFERLLAAEASVHGTPVDAVHLHEAGAVDALVDVVGVCAAVHHLLPRRVVVSPVSTGTGTVRCAHGVLPVPVPAVLEMLRDVPLTGAPLPGERLTPTGAALLLTLADAWGPLPPMRIVGSGTGAGARDDDDHPNVVRVVLGSTGDAASEERRVVVLTCTVDDATPQEIAWALERARDAGALDAYSAAVGMKKGRPGHQLTVLVRPDDREPVTRILLEETPTLGVRANFESRVELDRRVETVRTRWGAIRVKVGSREGAEVHAWPEYEDCAAAARHHGVPLRDVQREALRIHGTKAKGTGRRPRRGAP